MLKKYRTDEPLNVDSIGHARAAFYDVNFDHDSHSIINRTRINVSLDIFIYRCTKTPGNQRRRIE